MDRSPYAAVDSVFFVHAEHNESVFVSENICSMAASVKLKSVSAGEKRVIISRFGVICHERVGSGAHLKRIFEFCHILVLSAKSVYL